MTEQGRRIFNMVIAILVSVGAWVFVVYNYKPMTEVRYTSVPVTYSGETALSDRGLAVNQTSDETVSVVLSQRRVDARNISSEDILITADVSGCSAGDNNVSLTITGPGNTSVVSSSVDSIAVSVGRTKTETMEIDVRYSEDVGSNEEPIALDMSRAVAEVSGTSDTMSRISTIAAVLDYDEVGEDIKSFTARLRALDEDGETLQHVVIEPSEISLDACRGYTKTVSLSVPVINTNDENYERRYTAPSTVVIKGAEETIGSIRSIRAEEIDAGYYYEDAEIPINYVLPDGVYLAKASAGQTLKLTVTKREKKSDDSDDDA